jgi:hypothetical protein
VFTDRRSGFKNAQGLTITNCGASWPASRRRPGPVAGLRAAEERAPYAAR